MQFKNLNRETQWRAVKRYRGLAQTIASLEWFIANSATKGSIEAYRTADYSRMLACLHYRRALANLHREFIPDSTPEEQELFMVDLADAVREYYDLGDTE